MGMTVVDALVVTLGLDAAAFKRGKAEASQATKKLTAEEARAAKEIEDRNKRAAESFKSLRREVLALVALFTAGLGIKGLADFTGDTIKGAIATGQLSRELGMVPGQLRAVEKSFDRLGASAGDADEALKSIQEQAAKLKSGEFDNRLQAYALNASRAGVSASLEDVNDPIKKLQRDAEIAQKLAQTQGNGFAILAMQQEGYTRAMAYALMQGPQALQAEMARQQKLNELSQQEADRLRALDNRWKDFKDGISNTAQRVVIAMAPAFETIMKLLERLSGWFNANADKIGAQVGEMAEKFAAWVTSVNWDQVIADIKEFFQQLDKGVQSLGGWKTVLMALIGLKILSIVSPILQLAGALGGLGGSLGIIGRIGPAAIAVLAGLGIAKALGLPDTDKSKGAQDIREGKWGAASADLPAGDFLKAVAMKAQGKSNEEIANALAGGGATQTAPGAAVGSAPSSAGGAAGLFGRLEKQYGLPSGLLDNVWNAESSRGKNMLSSAGAKGHFQFMDATAKQYGVTNPYDLEQSATGAARMYADLLKQTGGNLPAALAAYNWGIGNVQKKGMGAMPAETRGYIAKVTSGMSSGAASPMLLAQQSNAAQIAQQSALAQGSAAGKVTYSTTTNETTISGPITIQTAATDANGIARDFGQAVQRQTFVAQANTGLS